MQSDFFPVIVNLLDESGLDDQWWERAQLVWYPNSLMEPQLEELGDGGG